ncbi:MAG: methionyl-tRNA formyltransferase [Dehalococcoidia bacterium]
MRIVVIGQAPFGAKVLERLLERGEEVVGAFTPPERRGRPDPLAEAAEAKGVPLFKVTSMKTEEVYQSFQSLRPDLGVMAFVTLIVPERVLYLPGLGTIQYHPSLLPKHRGASAINWAIINGDGKTGLTIFWPDKGLDTGPVLLQKEVQIGPDDTVGSIYFDKLFPMGVDAMMESIDLVKEGKAPHIPQEESQATYEGICRAENAEIDWAGEGQEVYNLIRGTNPQPGAWTLFKGQRLKIFDSEPRLGEDMGTPGEVVEVEEDGFLVAVGGGAIKVKRVQSPESKKVMAPEYIEQSGLKAGDRLGG